MSRVVDDVKLGDVVKHVHSGRLGAVVRILVGDPGRVSHVRVNVRLDKDRYERRWWNAGSISIVERATEGR